MRGASRFRTRRWQRFLGGAGGAECGGTLTIEFLRQRMPLQFSRACRPDAVRNNGDSGVWARRQTAPEHCGYPPMLIIFRKLSSLALRQLAGPLAKDLLLRAKTHLTDHSQRLTAALTQANERAWKTLEIALGGNGCGTGCWPRPRTKPCASKFRHSSRALCPVTTRVSWRVA